MTLIQEDLNAMRVEFDEALEEALSDPLSNLGNLAHEVKEMRWDLERWTENLKRHTGLVRSLVVKFAELRETVNKLAEVND